MTNAQETQAARAAGAVSEERLWRRHMELARFGATPKGGCNRQALTPEDAQARAAVAGWAAEAGFECSIDPIGNMFVRRPGTDADAAPVMTGSHLDTQPTGGRFDGIYGCLAGLEALQAIDAAGVQTRRPLEAVVWTNEEGTRFVPALTGSNAFVDPGALAGTLAIKDAAGVTVADALAQVRAALPEVRERPLGGEVAYFIEAHIEQGPILEAEGKTIGVVTGIQGWRRFLVEVTGEEGHAGTLPRKNRKDALAAAAAMVHALNQLMAEPDERIRFTVGRFDVSPSAPAVVPGRVTYTIDFRHPDVAVLTRLGDRLEPTVRANAGPCAVTVTETSRTKPIQFSGRVPDAILAAAERLNLPHMHIYSGAGHDAQNLFKICNTGMIFVPCEKGISHNEAENASPGDLAAGARVLAETLVDLAGRGPG